MVMYRHIMLENKAMRVMRSVTLVTSNASGIIAIVSVDTTAVTGTLGWAAMSGDFQNYRVRAMRFQFIPATVNATSTTGPYQGVLAISRFWGLAPATTTEMSVEPEMISVSTLEECWYDNNWLGFEDAKEWSPVGTALLPSNVFGISYASFGGPALAVSSTIYTVVKEFDVEFVGLI
jgi:hypothetical protein